MRRLLLSVLFLFFAQIILAQDGMIAGIIINEDDQPIPGAIIRVSKAGKAIETYSDEDGLFYTQLLHPDLYRMDIVIKGEIVRAGKVYIASVRKKKKFYHLKVRGDMIDVRVDGEDPFLRTRISKIEKDDDPMRYIIFDSPGTYPVRVRDINDNRFIIYMPREHMMKLK